jgi:hypothetical protein
MQEKLPTNQHVVLRGVLFPQPVFKNEVFCLLGPYDLSYDFKSRSLTTHLSDFLLPEKCVLDSDVVGTTLEL